MSDRSSEQAAVERANLDARIAFAAASFLLAYAFAALLDRVGAPERFAAAQCPVLFVAPDEDVVICPFAGRAMASAIPNARAVTLPRAGHSGHFEHPAEFNGMVEAFFAEVGADA